LKAIESRDRLVTIGICAFNEEANIGSMLKAILRQKFPFPTETIVVSDGSTDATESIVQEIASKNSSVRLIRHTTQEGKSQVLNTIFRECRGKIVITISADTQIQDGSISQMVEALNLPAVGMCWARPVPIFPARGLAERLGYLGLRLHDRFYRALNLAGEVKHSTGDLVAYRKEAFTQIPVECVNDDAYLAIQAARKGFKIRYLTETTTGASLPRTLFDYVQQRRRWVYGHFQVGSLLGEYSSVIEFTLTKKPMLVASVVLEELRDRPLELPVLLASLLVEFAVVVLALRDLVLHVKHAPWKVVRYAEQVAASGPAMAQARAN
jgi:glycosyltransferase involved in cell wall biosynthesis